jgi:hypothetical protein
VYGAVQAIQQHLGSGFTYDESPPKRSLPLDAFLFRDRRGYCQHFSGAMVLMLRMLGIPSRIAAGFAPGTQDGEGGGFVVRDLDAHSWVEVYFRGIGWVIFDPTPSAAPVSTESRLVVAGPAAGTRPGHATNVAEREAASSSPRPSADPAPVLLLGATVPLALAAAFVGLRRRRFGSLPPAAAAAAQARELRSALPRLGVAVPPGATLLELERRVGGDVRPRTAAYLSRLRGARFRPDGRPPPTLAERRRLRRELGARGRLRALLALPPGGPRPERR